MIFRLYSENNKQLLEICENITLRPVFKMVSIGIDSQLQSVHNVRDTTFKFLWHYCIADVRSLIPKLQQIKDRGLSVW